MLQTTDIRQTDGRRHITFAKNEIFARDNMYLFLGSEQATEVFGLLLEVYQTLYCCRSSITGRRCLAVADEALF